MKRQSKQFSNHFPGPYSVRASSEGVDKTFEVICISSNRVIAAAHYWEELEQAYLDTSNIANALNAQNGMLDPNLQSDRATFRREYPGPFKTRKGHCEGYGPFSEVYCRYTGKSVILVYRYFGNPSTKCIAKQIAAALNSYRSSIEDRTSTSAHQSAT